MANDQLPVTASTASLILASDMPDLLKVEVRQVGKLIGGDRGVDDCRSLDRQGVADRFLQLVGLARREAGATARANATKSGLGNSMACM